MSDIKAHIALLLGGLSSEREVSLSSGNQVYQALIDLGYKVTKIDMDRNLAKDIERLKPDIVFNALHGEYGEDGCVQGLLEIMQVPYTHSGVTASAIAMNKQQAKSIFKSVGIRCTEGFIASRQDILDATIEDKITRPYVVKPISEGSSVGVYIIQAGSNKVITDKDLLDKDEFLVETFIPGKELAVAVLDSGPLGVIEVKALEGFYDYSNKYTDGKTKHIMPADIPEEIYNQAMQDAFLAHKTIGCRGVSRSDFRYDVEKNNLYMLELNTHPGLTPLSLVPEIASHCGMDFKELIEYIVEQAICQK